MDRLKDHEAYSMDHSILINEIMRCASNADQNTCEMQMYFGGDHVKVEAKDLTFGKEYNGEIKADGTGDEMAYTLNVKKMQKDLNEQQFHIENLV